MVIYFKSIFIIVFLIIMQTGSIAPVKQIFKVPISIYDISAGEYKPIELYIHSPKSEIGEWYELMLMAQNNGLRLAYSSEWFRGRQYMEEKHPEAEKDFIEGPLEWTGTVLDFNDETLNEGIILNPDKTIKTIKTKLGKEQGIILPHESKYIKDLDDTYMPLARHLWGVEDPKRDLPVYAYLLVEPNGFKPVVRGDWRWHYHGNRQVNVDASYDPAHGRFAARLVSEARPENVFTLKEYEDMLRQISGRPILIE